MALLEKLRDKYFFYLVLALVVFIPLYPKLPLSEVAGTYVAIRLDDVFTAIVLGLWGLLNIRNFGKFLRDPIYLAFLLFWGIGLLSLISALFITYSVSPHLGLLHWARRIEYMSFFILAASTVTSIKQVRLVLTAFLVVTIITVFYGLGQIYLNFPVISTTNREFSKGLILYLTPGARLNSTFAGHYDFAAFLSIVLVFLGSLFFYVKKIHQKGVVAGTGLLSLMALGLTAARASFAAALLGIIVGLWLNGQRWLIVLVIVAAVGVVGLVPDLRHRLVATITVNLLEGGGPKYNPESINQQNWQKLTPDKRQQILDEATRSGAKVATISSDIAPGEPINTTELGVYRSYGIRIDVEWPRAINAFYKNPILGTGYSSLTIATDNDVLRALGEVGLLGTLSLALIFWMLVSRMLSFIRKESKSFERYFIVGSFCVLIVMFVTGLFIDVLEASKIATLFWFLMGVSWVVLNKFEKRKD